MYFIVGQVVYTWFWSHVCLICHCWTRVVLTHVSITCPSSWMAVIAMLDTCIHGLLENIGGVYKIFITYPSSQCCLSLLDKWWLCRCLVCVAGARVSVAEAETTFSFFRSTAASSLTARRRWALLANLHSVSRSDKSEVPPPPLFCTILQVQSSVSRMSPTFLWASLSSWPFFFSWELNSATASCTKVNETSHE